MSAEANRTLDIFTEASNLPKGERAAYLQRACAGDEELRGKVEALLRAHDEPSNFLEQSLGGIEIGEYGNAIGEKRGDRVGRYNRCRKMAEAAGGASSL